MADKTGFVVTRRLAPLIGQDRTECPNFDFKSLLQQKMDHLCVESVTRRTRLPCVTGDLPVYRGCGCCCIIHTGIGAVLNRAFCLTLRRLKVW